MGLIRAALGAAGGVLADQWVDYITCPAMSESVLAVLGERYKDGRSQNTKGTPNVISNGSKIDVPEGACMLIIESGKVADFCAEAGQYTYRSDIQPSLLGGGLKDLGKSFVEVGKRFAAGGTVTNQQFVYYINLKEIFNNRIGFGNIPFRDGEFNFTVRVQGFGTYSFKITDPLMFFKNVCGQFSANRYTKEEILKQMKAEVIEALQPALGEISKEKICYDQLTTKPIEIGKAINAKMSSEWRELRGMEVVRVAFESLTVDADSAAKIERFQETRIYTDPNMAAARMAGATASAMETAAGNTGGAMQGFMGMGMAGMAGGNQAAQMFQMAQAQQAPPPQAPAPAPAPAGVAGAAVAGGAGFAGWTCSCGAACTSGFCQNCGGKKPAAKEGWSCSCGTVNTGRFCQDCGGKKPEGAPMYACDKCGWKPEDVTKPPRFCPECGDPFGDEDKVSG